MTETAAGNVNRDALYGKRNGIDSIIRQIVYGELKAVLPVKVVESDTTNKRLIVLPLINQVTPDNKEVPHANLHDIPYGYEQAGECVIQIDPQPGDIGVVVCSYRDISRLKASQKAGTPATMRCYAWEDAIYLRTLWTPKIPEHVISISPDGGITLTSPRPVTVNADLHVNGSITASGDVTGGGISLDKHVHSGVQPGGGNTGKPQ